MNAPADIGFDHTLLDTVQRLASEAGQLAKRNDRDEQFDTGLWNRVRELGLAGLCVGEDQGGADVSISMFCRVCEALAVTDTTTSTLVHLQGNNAFLLRHAPNRSAANRVLEAMAAGEALTAYALTEPGAGSDAARIQATARPVEGGYVLNGTKCFSSWASMADVVLVFARIQGLPDKEAISCFVVRPPAKGFIISRLEKKMGLRASPLCEITLQDLFVPAEDCLGEEGLFRQTLAALDYSRVGIAAMAVGLAQGAFEYAFRYVHERHTFGQVVADFQGVQFKLADMATEVEAARALTYQCAKQADTGQTFTKLASMAKYLASDTAMRVTTDAVQLLGGHGYTAEHPVERMMRDAKSIQIFEGANEIQRVLVFRALRKELV
jgi:alkylation response protein AidB-like acyl-CoA dehydrogenase